MRFQYLKFFCNDPPFNDLWPPTHIEQLPYSYTLRCIWFYWLKRGWVHGKPYREFQILDHNPRIIAHRLEQRKKARRLAKLNSRRKYKIHRV